MQPAATGVLTVLQMSLRAAACFVIALVLVRIAGRRAFGMRTPFDNVIALLLGAVLSRAVVAASPFVPTIVACMVIVILHRSFAWLAMRHHWFGQLIKGDSIAVFEQGRLNHDGLRRALMSEEDIRESLRTMLHQESFDDIHEIRVERSGTIGVVATPKG